MPNTSRSRFPIDRRVIAAGLVAGAAVGAWAGSRTRPPMIPAGDSSEIDTPQVWIDWERARALAIRMNRQQTLTAPERQRLNAYYRELVQQCIPVVSAYTGDTLPETDERTFVMDRVDWINANIDGFRHLFQPLSELSALTPTDTVGGRVMSGVNRTVLSTEVGVLLGYLARRVLGQYDLALLGGETIDVGKLYYVEPNIQMLERTLGLPRHDFRMWLALHETTHAFEFEAHSWVRGHFSSLLTQYIEILKDEAKSLRGMRQISTVVSRVRDRDTDTSWIEAVMSPAQRELFNQMQALMCMIEGYSNHVMNAVGKDLLPTYTLIAERFAQRQRQRSPVEQVVARLIGLDLKLEQYRLGEEFIDAIVGRHGHEVARRVWESPDTLPTMDEIRRPDLWIARVHHRDVNALTH